MQTLTIELNSLSLTAPLDQSGATLVFATLVLPRPGIARKTTLLSASLQKGQVRFAQKSFHEKALFKEKIEGRFALTLQLSHPSTHSEIQKWLLSMTGLGLESVGDLLASGLEFKSLRPLLRAPFETLAEHFSDNNPDFILLGSLELESETLQSGELILPLRLEKRLRLTDLPPGPKTRDKRKASSQTYKKGLTLGEALLKIEVR